MAEFKPFDYGKAVGQGQQNALRSAEMMQVADKFQGQNALNQMAKEGVGGADKYNALMQQGRPDLARQEQAKDLQMEAAKLDFAAKSSRPVFDENSYQTFINKMVQSGSAQPGEIESMFGDTYGDGIQVQRGLKAFRGEAKGKIDELKMNLPGGFAQDYWQQGGNIVKKGPKYDRLTPKQRGVGSKSGKVVPATVNRFKLDMAESALSRIPDFTDSDNEAAQISWLNSYEKYIRNKDISAPQAERLASLDIIEASQTEQSAWGGSGKTYNPDVAPTALSPDEEAELTALEKEFGKK